MLVGCAATLSSVPLFAGLLRLMGDRGWLHSLPADAVSEDEALPALLPPPPPQ